MSLKINRTIGEMMVKALGRMFRPPASIICESIRTSMGTCRVSGGN